MIVLRVKDWRSLVSGLHVELSAARHSNCSSLCVPEIVDSPSLLLRSLSSRLLPFVSPNGPSLYKDYRCDPRLLTLLLSWHSENTRKHASFAVFTIFLTETLSVLFATMIVVMSIIQIGDIANSVNMWGFKIVALLCGLWKYLSYCSSAGPDLRWFTQALPWSMPFIVGAFASWRAVGG